MPSQKKTTSDFQDAKENTVSRALIWALLLLLKYKDTGWDGRYFKNSLSITQSNQSTDYVDFEIIELYLF